MALLIHSENPFLGHCPPDNTALIPTPLNIWPPACPHPANTYCASLPPIPKTNLLGDCTPPDNTLLGHFPHPDNTLLGATAPIQTTLQHQSAATSSFNCNIHDQSHYWNLVVILSGQWDKVDMHWSLCKFWPLCPIMSTWMWMHVLLIGGRGLFTNNY